MLRRVQRERAGRKRRDFAARSIAQIRSTPPQGCCDETYRADSAVVGCRGLDAWCGCTGLGPGSPGFQQPNIKILEHDPGYGGYWNWTLADPQNSDPSKRAER